AMAQPRVTKATAAYSAREARIGVFVFVIDLLLGWLVTRWRSLTGSLYWPAPAPARHRPAAPPRDRRSPPAARPDAAVAPPTDPPAGSLACGSATGLRRRAWRPVHPPWP